MKKYILIITSVLTIAQAVFADCSVPVCNISATIEQLKSQSSDERAAFLSNLYQQNSSSTDAASLRNLRAFGLQAYNQALALKDPANNILWAAYVRQIGLNGVLVHADFYKDEASSAFLETSQIPELVRDRQQQVRFSAFYRWKMEAPVLMDIKLIYDIYEFLNNSVELSKSLKDDDYVIREGLTALDLLSKRISYLYPIYEGVFAVKAQCLPKVQNCTAADLRTDRLVVMNSLTDLGVYTSLPVFKNTNFASSIGHERGRPADDINFIFAKSKVEKNGTYLKSQSEVLNSGARPSEIALQITSATQFVKASVTTTRETGALHLEGDVVYSPLKFYVDQVPALDNEPTIVGTFKGYFGCERVTFIVRQRLDKTLMATAFVGLKDDIKKIDFTMGEYVPHRKLFHLTGVGLNEFTPYKLTLALRYNEKQKLRWTGGFFSTTGYYQDVKVIRTGSVQEQVGPDVNETTVPMLHL